jgi:hypothetical protein
MIPSHALGVVTPSSESAELLNGAEPASKNRRKTHEMIAQYPSLLVVHLLMSWIHVGRIFPERPAQRTTRREVYSGNSSGLSEIRKQIAVSFMTICRSYSHENRTLVSP